MSERDMARFETGELRALAATLLGGVHELSVPTELGRAAMFAHLLWRRRAGGLSTLPR